VRGGKQIRRVKRRDQPGFAITSNDVAPYHRGVCLCALEGVSEHLFYVVDAEAAISWVQAIAPDKVEDVKARLTALHQRQEPLMH
tara:strand:- start:1278 stop:1532 length:255 start_codon:yes stop_codon:yes gene_type:complete